MPQYDTKHYQVMQALCVHVNHFLHQVPKMAGTKKASVWTDCTLDKLQQTRLAICTMKCFLANKLDLQECFTRHFEDPCTIRIAITQHLTDEHLDCSPAQADFDFTHMLLLRSTLLALPYYHDCANVNYTNSDATRLT